MNASQSHYGENPVRLGWNPLQFTEMMHYLYLPVAMQSGYGESTPLRLPDRLQFLKGLIFEALEDCQRFGDYVYVTARNGYATPDNPLNRPGWHCDGFGTDDLNYVWMDRWGSRIALQEFGPISADHFESLRQFEEWIDYAEEHQQGERIELLPNYLYRLSPYVVHTTPNVPAPGGMRSFVKISISQHRYNLLGNSHNYLFDYDWEMFPRDIVRNDPTANQADFYVPTEKADQ